MFNNLGNLADLMRNAGKLRETVEKATESLGQVQVEGTAGAGAVTAKANGRLTIVLVNLGIRGGAGGTQDRPAWVTTTSGPNEVWQAVALHELGHSFGLADEYDDASQPVPEPHPLEPNVTDRRNAAQAPWAALVT